MITKYGATDANATYVHILAALHVLVIRRTACVAASRLMSAVDSGASASTLTPRDARHELHTACACESVENVPFRVVYSTSRLRLSLAALVSNHSYRTSGRKQVKRNRERSRMESFSFY